MKKKEKSYGNKKTRDTNVDLQETKYLFRRLMLLASSNRDIDQKQDLGTYEFTLTPPPPTPQAPVHYFTPDEEVLPCSGKSKLIHALEAMDTLNSDSKNKTTNPLAPHYMWINAKRFRWLLGCDIQTLSEKV